MMENLTHDLDSDVHENNESSPQNMNDPPVEDSENKDTKVSLGPDNSQSDTNTQPDVTIGPKTTKVIENKGPPTGNPPKESKNDELPAIADNKKKAHKNKSKRKLLVPRKVIKGCYSDKQHWLRCYLPGQKYSQWIPECNIDPEFLKEYYKDHTKDGRKRNYSTKVFWKSKQSDN
ncbi:hypothetical protein ACF0H5_009345 [Mactra antiquata]